MKIVDGAIRVLPPGQTNQMNWNKPVSTGTFQGISARNIHGVPPSGNCNPAPRFGDLRESRTCTYDLFGYNVIARDQMYTAPRIGKGMGSAPGATIQVSSGSFYDAIGNEVSPSSLPLSFSGTLFYYENGVWVTADYSGGGNPAFSPISSPPFPYTPSYSVSVFDKLPGGSTLWVVIIIGLLIYFATKDR